MRKELTEDMRRKVASGVRHCRRIQLADEIHQAAAEYAKKEQKEFKRIFWILAGGWLLTAAAVVYVCVHFLLKWW